MLCRKVVKGELWVATKARQARTTGEQKKKERKCKSFLLREQKTRRRIKDCLRRVFVEAQPPKDWHATKTDTAPSSVVLHLLAHAQTPAKSVPSLQPGQHPMAARQHSDTTAANDTTSLANAIHSACTCMLLLYWLRVRTCIHTYKYIYKYTCC